MAEAERAEPEWVFVEPIDLKPALKRYNQGSKGKETRKHYNQSEKRKRSRARHYDKRKLFKMMAENATDEDLKRKVNMIGMVMRPMQKVRALLCREKRGSRSGAPQAYILGR